MLENYFKRKTRLNELRQGPMGEYIESMAAHLKQLGYSLKSGQRILTGVGKFNDFARKRGIKNAKEIDGELIARFIRQGKFSGNMTKDVTWSMKHMKEHLRQCGIMQNPSTAQPEDPFHALMGRYDHHMRDVRGLGASTRELYVRGARRFYTWLQKRYSDRPFRKLKGMDVLEFITDFAGLHESRGWRNGLSSQTRIFLKYLQLEGMIKVELDRVVPRIAGGRLSSIPRHLPWEKVRMLIDSVDISSPGGKRDKAVLLLIAALGLRSQEVRNLKFDDIDWRAGHIRLSETKTRRERLLPLPGEVGEALADYILSGRPKKDEPYVFLHHYAPHDPIIKTQVIGDIVRRRLRRLEMTAPSYGAHLLRHSLATHMVNQGVAIKVIADVLGHESIDTTAIYTKVDSKSLAAVALPFPGGES